MFVQQGFGVFAADAFRHRDQTILRRHDFAHRQIHAGFKAQIAPGDDAHHFAAIDHRKARKAHFVGHGIDLAHGSVRANDHGVAQHPRLIALDAAHLRGLLFGTQVFMNHAYAALLRDGDGQTRFRHGIHGSRHQRQTQLDIAREAGTQAGVLGQHFREGGHEEDVVKSQGFSQKAHGALLQKANYKSSALSRLTVRFPFPSSVR